MWRRAALCSQPKAAVSGLASRWGPLSLYSSSAAASPKVMNATKISSDAVPLVDIAPLLASHISVGAQQKAAILAEMKKACLETGFFTVPTKGVLPNDLINKAYTRTDEFLALPNEIKQKYHNKRTPNARGWTPMFEEPSYQPDVVSHLEGFDLARELPASYIAEGSSLGPNTWPEEIPGFQHDVYTLYEETTTLSHLLFKSFAEMLDLPPNTFLQHVSEEAEAFMRLLTYPETENHAQNSTVGIASHTDFECFTIIHQNGAGLHLRNRQGEWVQAPEYNDRLFVMVGDVLERWTNGVLKATEHRVVNSARKRQSIVRFNGADGDTVIAPLPLFVSAENPVKYATLTQREHVVQQIQEAEERLQETKAAQASA